MSCPSRQELAMLARGAASAEGAAEVLRHVQECAPVASSSSSAVAKLRQTRHIDCGDPDPGDGFADPQSPAARGSVDLQCDVSLPAIVFLATRL